MSGKKRTRSRSLDHRAPTPQTPATPIAVIDSAEQDHLPAENGSLSKRSRRMYALVPVALAILVSLNTLWNGWVADDDTQIVKNVAIQKLSSIPNSFTSSVWSYATSDILFTVDTYYRPFFMTL